MLVFLGVLVGLGLILYPAISNYLTEKNQSTAMQGYIEEQGNVSDEINRVQKEQAQEYNRQLLLQEEPDDYEEILNPDGNEIMGYLEIPSIKVYLPVYHGTSDGILQAGIGHLKHTSLPIGGAGTHAVLSGHTGMPGTRLLTDLDQLQEGDQFYLHVLDEVLAYEVDQIKVVEPDNMNDLRIEESQDYVTLVTCTPYGINSHRLLVRGRRVPYMEEVKERQIGRMEKSTWKQAYWKAVQKGVRWTGAAIGILLILSFLFRSVAGIPMVRASSGGMIHIQLPDLECGKSEKAGVKFFLYQAGKVSASGEPVLLPEYEVHRYPLTAEETEQVLKKIKNCLSGLPQKTAVTDRDGEAVFSGLEDGIYYIEAEEPNKYGTVKPLLVQIPCFTDEGKKPSRMIVSEPKATAKKDSQTDAAEMKPQEPLQKLKSPQTGDEAHLAEWMMLSLCAAILIAGIAERIRI